MEERKNKYTALWLVMKRECRRLVSRPLYLFCMVIAPLFCYVFFTTLMGSGLPTNLPVGAVDLDNSATSRQLLRNLDAFSQTGIVANYNSVSEAREAMQRGEIYGFFYIPDGLSSKAQSQRQPKLSFYTNNSYLIAGSLLFKDMKMMGELASGAASRSVLYAKGATEEQAMAFLQPIVIDTHPINNPWLNYSVYLCNTLVPGVLMLMIFMITVYSIGVEIKDRTAREWLRMGHNSIYISLAGKLLPHTVIFFIMGIFYNVYLYGYLHFPCNSGIIPMILATLLLVLASQCCGVIMIGTFPSLRLGLSFASLWGVISFSISGFSFPVMAMHPVLQALSNLFPLRHYFLIYVDQALNGYSMAYSWSNYMALLIFMILPFAVVHRLKEALIYYKYMP
nr:ABC transporter permease [uncultured Bacteroides sp.]